MLIVSMLQLRYDDIILLSTKLFLNRLSPRHTLILMNIASSIKQHLLAVFLHLCW
jgi:hypothetical protein